MTDTTTILNSAHRLGNLRGVIEVAAEKLRPGGEPRARIRRYLLDALKRDDETRQPKEPQS